MQPNIWVIFDNLMVQWQLFLNYSMGHVFSICHPNVFYWKYSHFMCSWKLTVNKDHSKLKYTRHPVTVPCYGCSVITAQCWCRCLAMYCCTRSLPLSVIRTYKGFKCFPLVHGVSLECPSQVCVLFPLGEGANLIVYSFVPSVQHALSSWENMISW